MENQIHVPNHQPEITNPCAWLRFKHLFKLKTSFHRYSRLPSLPRCLLKWCNYPPKQFGTLLLSWLHTSKKRMDIPRGKGWKFCAAFDLWNLLGFQHLPKRKVAQGAKIESSNYFHLNQTDGWHIGKQKKHVTELPFVSTPKFSGCIRAISISGCSKLIDPRCGDGEAPKRGAHEGPSHPTENIQRDQFESLEQQNPNCGCLLLGESLVRFLTVDDENQ